MFGNSQNKLKNLLNGFKTFFSKKLIKYKYDLLKIN